MDDTLLAALVAEAGEAPPAIALIGELPPEVHATLHRRWPQAACALIAQPVLQPDAEADAEADASIPLAVVGVPAKGDAPAWRATLAQLRDLRAARTLVLAAPDAVVGSEECVALGFRAVAHAPDGTRLLRFDLFDYKDRPEWLDARHWAHPELWDRFRW